MGHQHSIVRFALKQHGVITRFQFSELGIPAGSHSRIAKSRLLKKVNKGVYKLVDSECTWHQRALIAVYSCGKSACLSQLSALINLGLIHKNENTKRPSSGFDVSRARHAFHNHDLVQFHRTVYSQEFDNIFLCNSIPQINTEIAIIDGAHYLFDSQLSSTLDNAFRRGLVQYYSLARSLESLKSGPNRQSSRVKEMLEDYRKYSSISKQSESQLEKRIITKIKKQINAKLFQQYRVRVDGLDYRIDLAIPEYMIAIEIDGFEFHRSRYSFDHDRTRQNALVANGWTVLRFTSKHNESEILSSINSTISSWREKGSVLHRF